MLSPQKQLNRERLFNINTGDALLIKSTSDWISRLIRFFSGSEFIHSAIAVRIDSHLYVVESKLSSRYSYQMMPIEWWFARNPTDQIYLGKMPRCSDQTGARQKVRTILLDVMESLRSYELCWIIAVYFLQNWFGKARPQFKTAFKDRPLICSTLVQEAWERAGVIRTGNYMTPGDLVNFLGGEEALIPLNNELPANDKVFRPASNDGQLALTNVAG